VTDPAARWPAEADEVPVTHAQDPEPFRDALDGGDAPLDRDPEDRAHLGVLDVLREIRERGPVILMISDRITSHCVVASGYIIDGRGCEIVIMDPAPGHSFLEEGRNVAGVAARRQGEQTWRISHLDLAKVLDGAVTVRPAEATDG
jgi:hypothetical protein